MTARRIALAAAALGGAYYMMQRRRAHAGATAHRGIADVDPEPLTQVAGEGIDPDANDAAHSDVAEQNAKVDAVIPNP